MSRVRVFSTGLSLLFVAFLISCTASKDVRQTQTRLRGVDDFRSVDVETMSTLLKEYRTTDEDEVLYQLESGMLNHYRERWKRSAEHFQKADRAIERHYTKDISKNLKSFLVNDLQLPYEGEPYESIYLTSFNCLNYLHMDDRQGALVEMRKITHKLELLNDRNKGLAQSLMKRDTANAQTAVEKADDKLEGIDLLTDDESPPEIQQNSALGRFLTTLLYGKREQARSKLRGPNGYSDAANIEFQKLRTALADQGRLGYLSALSNAEEAWRVSSKDLLPPFWLPSVWTREEWAASEVLSTIYDLQVTVPGMTLPVSEQKKTQSSISVPEPNQLTQPATYNTLLVSFTGRAPQKKERAFDIPLVIDEETVQLHFAVPVLETPRSRVAHVRAITAGDTLGVPMIENMQSVAHEMFDAKKPVIYTRAVIRSFLKAGLTEGAEKTAKDEMGEAAGFLAEQAGNVMSSYSAQADTRGWQTMPGNAHAVVAKLPEGSHQVTFEFLSAQGRVLKRRTRTVSVQGGTDLALAESIYLN